MDIDSIVRGYSSEQYTRALFQTFINYLASRGMIDTLDLSGFMEEHFSKQLEKIKEEDLAKSKQAYEKYLNERIESKKNVNQR